MKIACIGWGSLIWNPENLKIKGEWQNDGPYLPVEFARQSQNGRITLVIDEKFEPQKTFWILMTQNSISDACSSLREREGTVDRHIHHVTSDAEPKNSIQEEIIKWLTEKELGCAIWTGLPPKFKGVDHKFPTLTDLFEYFDNLPNDKLELAKEYITKTPKQIDTKYRREIEAKYNWK